MSEAPCPYVSRGGIKLAAALQAFSLNPTGWICADLGCNVGGFTDCLLQHGAAKVFSVDTGYGTLAWKLRQDSRVCVHERANALYLEPANNACDLVVIDLGWTRQALAIPAALRWLKQNSPDAKSYIITLIKPHYESQEGKTRKGKSVVLDETQAQAITQRVLEAMPSLGVRVMGHIRSPIRGGHSRGIDGNIEYLTLLERA